MMMNKVIENDEPARLPDPTRAEQFWFHAVSYVGYSCGKPEYLSAPLASLTPDPDPDLHLTSIPTGYRSQTDPLLASPRMLRLQPQSSLYTTLSQHREVVRTSMVIDINKKSTFPSSLNINAWLYRKAV
jgi:hypothetical protein